MEVKPDVETIVKIKVIGVGGGGGSAINRMIASKIRGVDFLAVNTDLQILSRSLAPTKIAIGQAVTKGQGAGGDPTIGRKAAEESQNEIRDALAGADMVFITCGLGGGTGTGAAPVVAQLARDIGALTVAVVTKPFAFELTPRRNIADKGWDELASKVDSIITIPNDKILQIVDKKTTAIEAFQIADDVLQQGVRGISELITVPGELINVDFADVKAIMKETGSALMGIGRGSGENRAVEAAKSAISSPLLELSIEGAKGILFAITGGSDVGILEINEAAKVITSSVDPDARVIFGTTIDESLGDEIIVTVIAAGFNDRDKIVSKAPSYEKSYMERSTPSTNQLLFTPPMPRTVTPKQIVKEERKPRMDDSMQEEEDEEIDIPAFIRKKMN